MSKSTLNNNHYEYMVIGAGVSGLAMGKILHSEGKNFIILEKNSAIGGVWFECHYPGLGSHTPYYIYRFMSYPWPMEKSNKYNNEKDNFLDLYDEQPNREAILEYLKDYCGDFSQFIALNMQVIDATYSNEKKHFTMMIINPLTKEQTHLTCKYLICTLGNKFNAGYKRIPHVEGNTTHCKIYHSSDVNNIESLYQKKLLVVGTGKSSQDILITFYKNNIRDVTVLYEKPLWSLLYGHADKGNSEFTKFSVAFGLKKLFGWNRLTRPIINKLIKNIMVNIYDPRVDPDYWNLAIVKQEHVNILRSFHHSTIKKSEKIIINNNTISFGKKAFQADAVIFATGYSNIKDQLFDIFIEKNGKKVKYQPAMLYLGIVDSQIPQLVIPCPRSGVSSSLQSEIDAKWIYWFFQQSNPHYNKDYFYPIEFKFDQPSMLGKLRTYRKLLKKMSKDLNQPVLYQIFKSFPKACFKYKAVLMTKDLWQEFKK